MSRIRVGVPDKLTRAFEALHSDILPPAIQVLAYNAGITSFLVEGEAETILGEPDGHDEMGLYDSNTRAAITENTIELSENSGNDDQKHNVHDVVQTAYHEMGHAISFALGTAQPILKPIVPELERDLTLLTLDDWDRLAQIGIDIPLRKEGDLSYQSPSEIFESYNNFNKELYTGYAVYHLLNTDSHDVKSILPHVSDAIQSGAFDRKAYEKSYASLSAHPTMVAAYEADLKDLLEGKGPGGTQLIRNERPAFSNVVLFPENHEMPEENMRVSASIIDKHGDFVMDVSHYVPEEHGGDGDIVFLA